MLIHGLGGSRRSWALVLDGLAAERELIVPDLPGFGESAPLPGEITIAAMCDAIVDFLAARDLTGADLVGSSMGAMLVLELARRGVGGTTVALDPGGFWTPAQLKVFGLTMGASIRLVRRLAPVLPALMGNPVTRTLLLPQLSARPWALPPELALDELRSYATASSFDALLQDLVHAPPLRGAPAGSLGGRLVIGWGRNDLVTLPSQARRARAAFPDARLVWFERCGHFPHWDQPAATMRLILDATG